MNGISEDDISDEELMAFADGELAGDRHARVAKFVAASQDGAARLAVFTATGRGLSGLFERPMLEPVPQRLIDAVLKSGATLDTSIATTENVIRLDQRRAKLGLPSSKLWAMSAAACAALVIAGVGGQKIFDKRPAELDADLALARSDSGTRIAGGELAAVLDATPSETSTVRSISNNETTITPVFTFASASNGYCRQYVMARGESGLAGIACREAGGQWRVEVQQPIALKRSKTGEVVVAGKGGMADVDATFDRLISGSVFGAAEEAAVLNSKWRPTKP